MPQLDNARSGFIVRRSMAIVFWAIVVFVLAVMIRLPSLYESFWVDELHTAWAIWGELDQVAERAAMGNQTPLYFHLMWFWKAMVGESELALRMSSVLAVATGAVLLVFGVQQTTKSLAAGVLAGSVLAIETNSIYFGTEFRPYAFVMLLSVIATWAAVCLIGGQSRIGSANLRLVFVVAIGLAALLHPTSLVTFGVLALVVAAIGYFRNGFHFNLRISDFVSLIVIAAVIFTLINSSLGESWENRARWEAFGKVTKWSELWIKWPWLPLAIIPTLIWLLGKTPQTRTDIVRAYAPMIVGVLATGLFFVASYIDWVPLWHRRYFIAVLPMLAWSAGACAMLVLPTNASDTAKRFGWGIVLVVVGTLFWQQGSWRQFQATQTWGEPRGEDWRGAVDCVTEGRGQSKFVFLDAGLIEQPVIGLFGQGSGVAHWDYFRFPVLGPYALEAGPFYSVDGGSIVSPTSNRHIWLISRGGEAQVENWAKQQYGAHSKYERQYFGRVIVYHIQKK